MKKRLVLTVATLALLASAFGCQSWAPSKTEEGKCSVDRQWVPPKQDPQTGEWKEGYCEWLPGKSG